MAGNSGAFGTRDFIFDVRSATRDACLCLFFVFFEKRCNAAAASLPRGTLSASSSESDSASLLPSSFKKNRMAVTAIFVT